MRRIALAVLFSTVFAAQTVRANDAAVPAGKSKDPAVEAVVSEPAANDSMKETAAAPTPLKLVAPKTSMSGRATLLSLHAGFAGLQAYDVYSTTTALSLGATEANPVMRGAVRNRAMFIGLKVATTAGSIMVAERLWRDRHRAGAIALMAVSNGMMAIVAAHNASVIARVRR